MPVAAESHGASDKKNPHERKKRWETEGNPPPPTKEVYPRGTPHEPPPRRYSDRNRLMAMADETTPTKTPANAIAP